MKRKMGSALYRSNESPPANSKESGIKKARTDQATGCTQSLNLSGKGDGKAELCQAETVITEGEDLTKCTSKTEHFSGMLTKPLMRAKNSMSSHLHQIWKHFPNTNTNSLTKVQNASKQFLLPNFTPSSSAKLPVPAIVSSIASKVELEHFPLCLPVPQTGAQAMKSQSVSTLFQLQCSKSIQTLMPTFSSVASGSQHSVTVSSSRSSFHGSSSTPMATSYSLVPSRSCHSTSVSSTTIPVSKQSELSPGEKDEENCKQNIGKTVSVRHSAEPSLKEGDGENFEETMRTDQASASVCQKTSSVTKSKITASVSGKTSSVVKRKATASVSQKTDSGAKSVVRNGKRGGTQSSGRGHEGSEAGAKAVEGVNASSSRQYTQGSDACTDSTFEDYYQHSLTQLPRQWEWTRSGQIHQQQGLYQYHHRSRRRPVEFSVMSYNILAQNLLEDHNYLYTGCNFHSLEWEQRRQLLMGEIAYHCPDILNLQEVNKDHFYDYLQPRLERLGYESCYQKRTGDKSDGCVTLWKKDKFELLRFSPVSYCRGGLLDRDNIAIIVELRPIRSGRRHSNHGGGPGNAWDKIVVANTHLLFNPRRGDIKLAQLMILMAEIDKHAYLGPSTASKPPASKPSSASKQPPSAASQPPSKAQGQYCPIILTGDLNLEPQSPLYKFVVSGQMDYEGLLLRDMSGQEEGRYGRNLFLERNFFSQMYGVTDSCQYHTAVTDRLKEPDGCQSLVLSEQSRKSCSDRGGTKSTYSDGRGNLVPSEPSQKSCRDGGGTKSAYSRRMCQSAGRLWHHLNLVSAYRHHVERLGRAREVTTHHNHGQCSVDYIFYSVESKDAHFHRNEVRLSSVRDGKLRLLGRYGLMSAGELNTLGGIPNDLLPSDHLCLITKFLLT